MQKKVEEKKKELEKTKGETSAGVLKENVSCEHYGRRSSIRTPNRNIRYFEKVKFFITKYCSKWYEEIFESWSKRVEFF